MPNLDKTGPEGNGPNGRGRGDCADAENQTAGARFGCRRGGRGRRGRCGGFGGSGRSLAEREACLEQRLSEVRAARKGERTN